MRKNLTTNEAAAVLGLRPQTLRKRYCTSGSYFGLRPSKLSNRQLRWSAEEIENFIKGE